MADVFVVGAGMPGMLAAALLAQRGLSVTLVEQSGRLGGLYGSVDYGAGGVFDYGMHLLYDSGVEEVDTLLAGLLDDWQVMEGNRKDIAGVFWNGKLQEYSPYIDLRHLSPSVKEACMRHVPSDGESAKAYFCGRFGDVVGAYLCKVVEKLYGMPAEQVSALAARQPAMDRVLLVDESEMAAVLADEGLRERIGYPEQLKLPVMRRFAQKARYPSVMGIGQVVEALAERMRVLGVRIALDTKVSKMECGVQEVRGLWLQDSQGNVREEKPAVVLWTAGQGALHRLLLPQARQKMFDVPKAAHVHLRFAEKPRMGELYHFYVFDEGFSSFRVTSYGNYCPGAKNALGWPVCVEMWGQGDDAAMVEAAVRELRAFGVVDAEPSFSAVQRVVHYHAMFGLAQVKGQALLRDEVAALGLRNLRAAGILAEGAELLLYEIAQDVHVKVGYLSGLVG